MRHHGADPLVLDLDDENRTLSRFFPEALQVEIKKKSSHDILVERALKGDSLIIADLKAGTGRDVLDWWLTCRLKNFSHRGCSLCVWPLHFIPRKRRSASNALDRSAATLKRDRSASNPQVRVKSPA